jgi:glutamine cyclotransferase
MNIKGEDMILNGEGSKYISVRNSETYDLKNNVNLNLNKTKIKSVNNIAKKL